ncbi:MAG TPA: phosphoribosyltransferase family protein [Longimicrobiales bacterium]|nr:phosphoribosyltransferase family protein [Longimicrobiales bacterium]
MAFDRPVQDTFDAPVGSLRDDGVLELTWEVFGELCRALALNVARDYEPELIIGIAKAGVIPGAVIASILRCDFHSIKISRRAGAELVHDEPRILSAAPPEAAGKRVLIVDEICTTGETLRMATAAVRAVRAREIRTATSFAKSGQYRPDFFAVETDAMVIFPWDRQVVAPEGLITNPQYQDLL